MCVYMCFVCVGMLGSTSQFQIRELQRQNRDLQQVNYLSYIHLSNIYIRTRSHPLTTKPASNANPVPPSAPLTTTCLFSHDGMWCVCVALS